MADLQSIIDAYNSVRTQGAKGLGTGSAYTDLAKAIAADPALKEKYGSTAEAINKVTDLINQHAIKDFQGQTPAWAYEMFLGLPSTVTSQVPQQIDPEAARLDRNYRVMGTPSGDEYIDTGFRREVASDFNAPLFANYDLTGKLTGYTTNDQANRVYTSDPNWIQASFDPSGKATPFSGSTGGGGFFSNLLGGYADILKATGPVGLAAASVIAPQVLPEIFGGGAAATAGAEEIAAMQAASQGMAPIASTGLLSAETALPNVASVPELPIVNQVSTPATSSLYDLAPSTPSSGLGLQAGMGEGTNLFAPAAGIEGGGLGLQLPQAANLDLMGGAQGLTTMAAGNSGLLGETGIGTTSTTVMNPITGQPMGQQLDGLDTGIAGTPPTTPTTSTPSVQQQFIQKLLGTLMADNTSTSLGSGLLGGLGSYLQGNISKEAAQALADKLGTATGSAVAGSQFRPVGITTRFGASNFQVNPTTGQLESAGYTPSALSDQLQQGAQGVYNLGQGYVAQSPEAAASQWLQAQQNLLAPSRDVALSKIRNNLFQSGREGLSVAQGGDLQAANPELAAYYNSLANQNAQLAANAQQFGQQQSQFGAGLLGSGLNLMGGINTLEQQPLALGAGLGQQAASAGAQAGRLGLAGTQAGQDYLYKAMTYSPLANLLQGAGGSSLGNQAAGNLFNGLINNAGNWLGGLFGSTPNIDYSQYLNTQMAGLGNTGDIGLMY